MHRKTRTRCQRREIRGEFAWLWVGDCRRPLSCQRYLELLARVPMQIQQQAAERQSGYVRGRERTHKFQVEQESAISRLAVAVHIRFARSFDDTWLHIVG